LDDQEVHTQFHCSPDSANRLALCASSANQMKFQFLTFKVVGNTTAIEISFDAKNLISNAID